RSRRCGRGRTPVIVFGTPFTGHEPPFIEDCVDVGARRSDVPFMTELTDRLEQFEHRLRSMETELYELRSLARLAETTPEPEPQPEQPLWELITPEPAAEPAPAPTFFEMPATVEPPEPRQPFDFSVLLGARALAWTGAAVM